jgi:hypothetical protein
MTNDASTHCNTWDNAQDTVMEILTDLAVVIGALMYVCFRKRETKAEQSWLRKVAERILAEIDPDEDEEPYNAQDDSRKMFWFHLFMALLSVYLSMVLTNWGSANITNNNKKTYDK